MIAGLRLARTFGPQRPDRNADRAQHQFAQEQQAKRCHADEPPDAASRAEAVAQEDEGQGCDSGAEHEVRQRQAAGDGRPERARGRRRSRQSSWRLLQARPPRRSAGDRGGRSAAAVPALDAAAPAKARASATSAVSAAAVPTPNQRWRRAQVVNLVSAPLPRNFPHVPAARRCGTRAGFRRSGSAVH